MKKPILRSVILAMAILSTAVAAADDFTVGKLTYTIIDGTTNVKVKAANKSISGDVVIPETVYNGSTPYSVTEIADEGFHSCDNLTSIVVPNSVTTLGCAAFANSKYLTDVNIGSGVTSLTSNGNLTYGGTFEMCNRLKKVTFAEGSHLTTIENWAFHRCYDLEEIVFPSTVTQIGHRIFVNCNSLTRIVLPVSAVPQLIESNDDPFSGFNGADKLLIEVPVNALTAFETADIWKNMKYMMQLTGTNISKLSLKSVFGTVNQIEIDSHDHLFITNHDTQKAHWYLNNTQAQNVSFVLLACSYVDYKKNELTLDIYSLADDGTETLHESVPIKLYNPDNNEGQYLQYKVDLLNTMPVGRYKLALSAVKDRISFRELYIGSPDKFYCLDYEVRPFGAGDLTPNKLTPLSKWYFTAQAEVELTAVPSSAWSTFYNWTDENGQVISAAATNTFTVDGHKKITANFNVAAQQIPNADFNTQQTVLYTTSDDYNTIQWYTSGTHPLYAYIHEGDIATYYVISTKPAIYNLKFKTSNRNDESANYTIEVLDKDNNVIFTSATTTIAKTSGWYESDMTQQQVQIAAPLMPNETYSVKFKFGSDNHYSGECCNYCDVNFDLVAVVADRVVLDKSAETVKVGATTTLKATATASTGDDVTEGYDAVTWTSSDEAVATVSGGVVTAIGAGEALITATGVQIPAATASCAISVPQPVTSITAPETAEVYTGETTSVTATVNPANAADKTLAWTSSDATVATVDQTGKVTGVKAGSATITIVATDRNAVSATVAVTVKQKVTTIALNETAKTINKGATLQLSASCAPVDATLKTVTWTSSNESVATVNGDGLVKALAGGTAIITATANDGKGASATCEITVEVPVTSVTLDKTSETLYKDQTIQLTATVNPEDATVKTVTWSTSAPTVATVSASGLVTAIAPGDATITATSTADATKSATFALHVLSVSATGTGANQLFFLDETNNSTFGDNYIAWDNATSKNWVANSIVLTDGSPYTCPFNIAAATLTYNRTFATDNWAPLYVPFDMAYSEWSTDATVAELAGVHMYDDGRATVVEFITVKDGSIRPNTPYVIKPNTAGDLSIICSNKTLAASPVEGDMFISCGTPRWSYKFFGNYQPMTAAEIDAIDVSRPYIMTTTGKFAHVSSEATLPAFRFYIVKAKSDNGYWGAPAYTNADDEIMIMIDGQIISSNETNGLIEIITEGDNGLYYDLSGRPVQAPTHGIYIHNGQKVYIK